MRENTRRNAASGFRPQSQYRPMFTPNPEARKVTFLTRKPTLHRASKDNDAAPSALALTEEKGLEEGTLAPSGDLGSVGEPETRQQHSASLTLSSPSAQALLLVRESEAAEVAEPEAVRKSESGEWPSEVEASGSTESMQPRRAPSPMPSSSRSAPKRAPSPTPSRNTSESAHPPRPSRSVRMRTPRRLPDPPSIPPGFAGRSSSPTPSGSRTDVSHSRSPSVGSSRAHEASSSTSPIPAVPSVPPVPPMPPMPPMPPAVGPSSPSSSSQRHSWARSPLRNSVLASDQPVIMPRPKHAPHPSGESRPVSPTSTWGRVPSVSGSASQYSAESGEQHRRYLGSVRRGKAPAAGPSGVNQRTMSTQSSVSVYSTDSFGRAEER